MIPTFSIIVTVNNSAEYLDQFFESLTNQVDPDFEALLVVEHSEDDSANRCHAQAQKDKRFRVYELPRTGSDSIAHNWGITHAIGEYAIFASGCDWLEFDALARLSVLIEHTKSPDLIITSANEYKKKTDGSFKLTRVLQNLPDKKAGMVFSGEELIINSWRFRGNALCYTHLNVCKLEFLRAHELYQLPRVLQEDTDWVPRVWYYAKTVTLLPQPIYNSRKDTSSMQRVGSIKKLLDMSTILATQFTFIDEIRAPQPIASILSNQVLSQFYWYMFFPKYRKQFTHQQRIAALHKVLFRNTGRFRRMASLTTIPKRLALPLVLLAYEYNWFLPVNLYFSCIYYPLSKLRRS